jgi:hypothetical protein
MDKDTAIVTQVAAKIAADLVTREATTEAKLGEFAILFTSIKDIVFEAIGSSAPVMETQSTPTSTSASSGGNLSLLLANNMAICQTGSSKHASVMV